MKGMMAGVIYQNFTMMTARAVVTAMMRLAAINSPKAFAMYCSITFTRDVSFPVG